MTYLHEGEPLVIGQVERRSHDEPVVSRHTTRWGLRSFRCLSGLTSLRLATTVTDSCPGLRSHTHSRSCSLLAKRLTILPLSQARPSFNTLKRKYLQSNQGPDVCKQILFGYSSVYGFVSGPSVLHFFIVKNVMMSMSMPVSVCTWVHIVECSSPPPPNDIWNNWPILIAFWIQCHWRTSIFELILFHSNTNIRVI